MHWFIMNNFINPDKVLRIKIGVTANLPPIRVLVQITSSNHNVKHNVTIMSPR